MAKDKDLGFKMCLLRACREVHQSLCSQVEEQLASHLHGMVPGNCEQDWQLPLVQPPAKDWTR